MAEPSNWSRACAWLAAGGWSARQAVYVIVGRAWCPQCGIVADLIAHPETTIVHCGCGAVARLGACGDEAYTPILAAAEATAP